MVLPVGFTHGILGFAIPLVAYWSGNITLHTNLFKFNEKYVSNSGFLFGRHSRLMAFTYFKQLLKNALELEFGQKYIFILSSTHISFKENLLCFSPPAKNNHGKFAQQSDGSIEPSTSTTSQVWPEIWLVLSMKQPFQCSIPTVCLFTFYCGTRFSSLQSKNQDSTANETYIFYTIEMWFFSHINDF